MSEAWIYQEQFGSTSYREDYEMFEDLDYQANSKLARDLAPQLVGYLKNPVACGLWRLEGAWTDNLGLCQGIFDEICGEIDGKKTIEIKNARGIRRIRISDELIGKLHHAINRTLSFPLFLFSYIAEQDGLTTEESEFELDVDKQYQLALNFIDIARIKSDHSEAYAFFKEHILCSSYDSRARANKITRHKHGFFVVNKSPREHREMSAFSWQSAPLRSLAKFFSLIGKLENYRLMPIFSPEEEVFEPYLDMLQICLPQIFTQEHLQPTIRKSLSHYKECNFTDCVSATGLAAEDVLVQVFETLFREHISKSLTLGQLLDEINRRTSALYKQKAEPPPEITALYSDINNALAADGDKGALALDIMRRLITIQAAFNKAQAAAADKASKTDQIKQLLPPRVASCVNDLIKFRNACSHKSRVPIGPYEAKRSMYSLVVFYSWWEAEKLAIDWDDSADEIIKGIVSRQAR